MSGIWPFNKNVFTFDEYASAVVTDIILNCEGQTAYNEEEPKQQETSEISPESIRPYPKAS